MDESGLSCIIYPIIMVGILMLAVLLIFIVRRRLRRARLAKIDTLLAVLRRLQPDPGDRIALEELATLTRSPSLWTVQTVSTSVQELWNLAVRVAFSNLHNAAGENVAYRVVVPLASTPVFDPQYLVAAIYEALLSSDVGRSAHGIVLKCLPAIPIEAPHRQWLYDRALDLVQRTPGSADLAVLALEIGRWHFGLSRPDGKVTVYDEQAIQNDISVRRSSK